MVGVLFVSSQGISVKILCQTSWRDRKTYIHVVSAITVIIILIIIITSSSSNYCQTKSRETKLVRFCQSVVLLQRLKWLCRPMHEWQSLLHTAQMKLEEAGQSWAVFEASALFFIFQVTFFISFLNYLILWPSPAGTMTRGIFWVVWMNFACFEVTFARVLEPQNKAPQLPDPCRQLSV